MGIIFYNSTRIKNQNFEILLNRYMIFKHENMLLDKYISILVYQLIINSF